LKKYSLNKQEEDDFMKKMIAVLSAVGLFAAAVPALADLSVTTSNNGQALANAILGGGITASNVTFTGSDISAGFFYGGDTAGITLHNGILLTSGEATGAVGPNNSNWYTGSNSAGPGDADLSSLIAANPYSIDHPTNDATVLEFDFKANGGSLFFNYVFASEEYSEWVNTDFNDVFGFFLDGTNIALIPGTTTPVSINNVNGGGLYPADPVASNSQYFIDNHFVQDGTSAHNIQYDGFTKVLQAQANSLGTGTHHIKLAIADVGDTAYDSGVFIQAYSFANGESDPEIELEDPKNPVPEPGTMMLLGIGMLGMAVYGKRRMNKEA
jgi:hypothetical protein